MRKSFFFALLVLLWVSISSAQTRPALSPAVGEFVKVDAPSVALTHVRVINGTGSPAREDQTILIAGGKIQALGDSAATRVPADAKVLELNGYTVIPGLVGMHDHMFYTARVNLTSQGKLEAPGFLVQQLSFSAPRLYLAAGVTSLRTTGSVEPYADLYLKKAIDEGKTPGPKMYVTAPYLEGQGTEFTQMHELSGPEDARKTVNYWADEGATSFKAYMHITRAELGAAIEAAHKRGLKVTGHLCSVGFREAAELGIDDLEHGFVVDTEFDPGKTPDVCPAGLNQSFAKLDEDGAPVQETIRTLVQHHVALTSTMPVFELVVPNRPPLQQRVLDAMLPESRISYLTKRALRHGRPDNNFAALLKKEMALERTFVKAGGLLLAGPDPTGIGGVLPGFGDQREVELLVEAGFTPVEAMHIATANGAQFLGVADRIGTIAPGKDADLAVIHGNPAAAIGDIEKVELVFKDGVGYDSAKLIESVRGMVGLR
jgi:imidazolonepropionase-like amidohydrolase